MAVVNCFKNCRWRMCFLEHSSPSDFYVSCWQDNHLPWPLLALRSFLFLFSTCVGVTSLALEPNLAYWFIYFTHWGFILIILMSGFSTAISTYAFFRRPIGKHCLFLYLWFSV